MKKLCAILMAALMLCLLSGCGDDSLPQTVKIAVMGNRADFYPTYEEGIERAVNDLNKEYAAGGYKVECEFYNDHGSYEEGAAIIDRLAADASVTAVIGAVDMDINKTAAYIFDNADKLFVVPYYLYDSVYEDNYYDTVLSLCNSAATVGKTLCGAVAETNAKRWAVCSAATDFERMEMNSFLQNAAAKDITVVDCVDISMLEHQFDEIYKHWELLGVEGVVMFPSDKEGFDVLKKLKHRNPNIICAGDTAFDNSVMLDNDAELMRVMNGFIMADEFMMRDETEREIDRIRDMARECKQKTGIELDTWYIQAYNAVRMIADTAIQNRVFGSPEIAKLLHENGYAGFCQDFNFAENGLQVTGVLKYNIIGESGYSQEYILEN